MKTKKVSDLHQDIDITKLPFSFHYWEVLEIDDSNHREKSSFGHYNTASAFPTPFYKPISTIVDIENLS